MTIPAVATVDEKYQAPHFALSKIHPSKTNPRKTPDPEWIKELTESIRVHGVLQPVVLRPHPTIKGEWELVIGSCRDKAARAAGLKEIPGTVRNLTDGEALELQLVE